MGEPVCCGKPMRMEEVVDGTECYYCTICGMDDYRTPQWEPDREYRAGYDYAAGYAD